MKKQYILSERAHFMCPNMHFGMLMEIEKEYDIEAIERLNWYEKGCEEHLKGLIEFGCVTGSEEERLELSARIKRILGDS